MIRKRRFLLLALALLLASVVSAQRRLTFRIADFELAEEDLTARNEKYQQKDNDGNLCAIVKVRTDNPDDNLQDYKFDFGTYIDVKRTEMHDDALWIWVQQGAKKISIRREGYTSISQHSLGLTIQKGRTYNMLLSAQMPEVRYRIVQFQVEPADEGAIVKVKREDSDGDYELWGTVDAAGGKAQRLETGAVYRYEVSAPYYETAEGRIVLANADENHVECVALKPNFGYLEVADEQGIAGAEVYVNDRRIGTVPYTSKERWDIGENYRIMISKGELYKTYNATFAILNGETTRLAPKLESNFAETTITVPDNAEILIDGESRGRSKWSGILKAGTYNVECRLDDLHRPTRRQITVKPDKAETFTMDAPTPITGSLYVTSNPLGATIQLDGTEVGQTPKEIRDVLVGSHALRILREGYRVEEQVVNVSEEKMTETNFELRDFARFTITSQPRARLTLDGEDKGMTPYSFEGASGDYDIRLACRRYKAYHQQTQLRSSAPDTTFHLHRQYVQRNSSYVQASFQAGTLMGFGANVGGYIYDVNAEVYTTFGLGGETGYLNYADNAAASTEERLVARIFGGRVGYGIIVGSRLRITPQVGLGALTVKSDNITANALCATLGCRVEYAIAPYVGVSLTPEGQLAISKKDMFKQLSDCSSKVKGWGTGGGARLGVYVFF